MVFLTVAYICLSFQLISTFLTCCIYVYLFLLTLKKTFDTIMVSLVCLSLKCYTQHFLENIDPSTLNSENSFTVHYTVYIYIMSLFSGIFYSASYICWMNCITFAFFYICFTLHHRSLVYLIYFRLHCITKHMFYTTWTMNC